MSFLNSARCMTFLDFERISVVNLKLRSFFSASPAELVVLGKNSLNRAKKARRPSRTRGRWRRHHQGVSSVLADGGQDPSK
eukprot:1266210-Pyramimonas_sp.AAC.1